MNSLHTVALCQADWQIVFTALKATAAGQFAQAHRLGLQSPRGAILYDDGKKYSAVADYIDFHLPELIQS